MTEDQFRRAIQVQTDEYIKRLSVAYGLLYHNSATLIEMAHKDGMEAEMVAEIVRDEHERLEQVMGQILAEYTRPQPVRVH